MPQNKLFCPICHEEVATACDYTRNEGGVIKTYHICCWNESERFMKTIPCEYCKSIDAATPASPRKKYKYCPMCGRRREN